jgi:hypothetical protein
MHQSLASVLEKAGTAKDGESLILLKGLQQHGKTREHKEKEGHMSQHLKKNQGQEKRMHQSLASVLEKAGTAKDGASLILLKGLQQHGKTREHKGRKRHMSQYLKIKCRKSE